MPSLRLRLVFWLLPLLLLGQEPYYNTEQIQEEWQDYTRFQKQELLSFCNFLITEGFYERALLGLFQYLYKYPGDSLEPVIYYHIARSYELAENPALAQRYYRRVLHVVDSTSFVYQAAAYRDLSLQLKKGAYEDVLQQTELTEDPYELVFRGYAFFHQLDWKAARQSFLAAEERFDHPHYSQLLAPLFQAVDNAAQVPLRNRFLSFLTALVPGGGHAYLGEWDSALGSFLSVSTLLVGLAAIPALTQSGNMAYMDVYQQTYPVNTEVITSNGQIQAPRHSPLPSKVRLKKNRQTYFYPTLTFALSIYAGSIWKTVAEVDEANLKRVQIYVDQVTMELPVDRFLDFPEPEIAVK